MSRSERAKYRLLRTGTAASPPPELQKSWRSRGYWTDQRLGWLLDHASQVWPDREAIVDDTGRYTYKELQQRSDSIARALILAGVKPGQVVSWMLPNGIDAVAVATAAWRVGAVSNPIVTIYRRHELTFILEQLRPFAVITANKFRKRHLADELDEILAAIGHEPATRLVSGGAVGGWLDIDALASTSRPPIRIEPMPAQRPALVLYTSGSTTEPKGVVHSSVSLIHDARSMVRARTLSGRDRFFTPSPLTHVTGTLTGMIVPLLLGATNILQASWDPDIAVARIQREGATYVAGAQIFLQELIEEYERRRIRSTLKQFTSGGSSVAPQLIERADELGIAAHRVWGMTEFPTSTMARSDDPLHLRAHTDGHRAEAVDVEAFDNDGRQLPVGREGELWVRGPEQMLGYLEPTLNKAAYTTGGWLRTGDVGYVDDIGSVTVVGRIKDIVNRGGEKFAAREIEELLSTHPAVADVAIIGVPGGPLGERLCAAIVFQKDRIASPDELKAYLDTCQVAKQKIPEAFQFFKHLPRTAAGKIQKFRLIESWDDAKGVKH